MKSILPYSIAVLIIAIAAAILGFTGIAGSRAWVLQILCGVFLSIACLSFFAADSVK